jgi:hypothetical protein
MGSVLSVLQFLPLLQTAAKRSISVAWAPSFPFCKSFPFIRRQSSKGKSHQNQAFETGFPFSFLQFLPLYQTAAKYKGEVVLHVIDKAWWAISNIEMIQAFSNYKVGTFVKRSKLIAKICGYLAETDSCTIQGLGG